MNEIWVMPNLDFVYELWHLCWWSSPKSELWLWFVNLFTLVYFAPRGSWICNNRRGKIIHYPSHWYSSKGNRGGFRWKGETKRGDKGRSFGCMKWCSVEGDGWRKGDRKRLVDRQTCLCWSTCVSVIWQRSDKVTHWKSILWSICPEIGLTTGSSTEIHLTCKMNMLGHFPIFPSMSGQVWHQTHQMIFKPEQDNKT